GLRLGLGLPRPAWRGCRPRATRGLRGRLHRPAVPLPWPVAVAVTLAVAVPVAVVRRTAHADRSEGDGGLRAGRLGDGADAVEQHAELVAGELVALDESVAHRFDHDPLLLEEDT